MRYHTVLPLGGLNLGGSGPWEFACGFTLATLPDWIQTDQWIKRLSTLDQKAISEATHCLAVEYEAEALGAPDPSWKGSDRRSIQSVKVLHGILANLALWLSNPCPVGFRLVFHAPEFDGIPSIQSYERRGGLLCHPNDKRGLVTDADLPTAIQLHHSLLEVSQDETTALWSAVWSTWAGLQMNSLPIRYLLFWIALEALFGPEDAREITYRLSQRLAFFLEEKRDEEFLQQYFKLAKKGYGFRSKIVHGRWRQQDINKEMAIAEKFVRRSLVRVLGDPNLIETFSARTSRNCRESYLDSLVFRQ